MITKLRIQLSVVFLYPIFNTDPVVQSYTNRGRCGLYLRPEVTRSAVGGGGLVCDVTGAYEGPGWGLDAD